MIPAQFHAAMSRLAAAPLPPAGLDVVRYRDGEDEMVVFRIPLREDTATAALTQAEREVIALIMKGCSNAEIGAARGTSPRTVANQIQSLFRKLGVGSRAELVATCAMWRADAPRRT